MTNLLARHEVCQADCAFISPFVGRLVESRDSNWPKALSHSPQDWVESMAIQKLAESHDLGRDQYGGLQNLTHILSRAGRTIISSCSSPFRRNRKKRATHKAPRNEFPQTRITPNCLQVDSMLLNIPSPLLMPSRTPQMKSIAKARPTCL